MVLDKEDDGGRGARFAEMPCCVNDRLSIGGDTADKVKAGKIGKQQLFMVG